AAAARATRRRRASRLRRPAADGGERRRHAVIDVPARSRPRRRRRTADGGQRGVPAPLHDARQPAAAAVRRRGHATRRRAAGRADRRVSDPRAGSDDRMTALKRIARLSAAFLGSNVARGGIAFVLSLVIGRALGVERFGRWVWCTTWAATLTFVCDLGLGLLLPRDGARTEDVGAAIRDSIGELAGSALVLRLAVAIPAAAVMIVAAPWVAGDAETVRGLQ